MPTPSAALHPAATFAAWMTGSQAGAEAAIEAAGPLAPDLTSQMTAVLGQFKGKGVGRTDLDAVLRSDRTIAVGLDHPLVGGNMTFGGVTQARLARVSQ